MHFGNLLFIPSSVDPDLAVFSEESIKSAEIAIKLLQLDDYFMKQSLLTKKIQSGSRNASITFSPYSINNAIENRNAMVKELYNRVFDWIVNKINTEINCTEVQTIGKLLTH